MLNKFTSLVLVSALVCPLAGTPAFADTPSGREDKAKVAETPAESGSVARTEARPNEKLRADMLKLITDAKAGKVAPAARPQIQPAKSNRLSKGAKIAIGVGIAVAVIVTVVALSNKGPGRVL